MRKLDALGLAAFKVLYEPLNNTKIKLLLETYHLHSFKTKKSKKTAPKHFDASTSKFDANVLIAEDNIINQKLIKRTLEDMGLNVTIANNGLEAFQKRKDGNFDLIFMDIQMPFLDGVEATKEILEYEQDYNQPHVPIIALTANALKGDRERFLEAGLDEYTTKPLVREDIISLLNHFLAEQIVSIDPEDSETVHIEPITAKKNESETLIAEVPEVITMQDIGEEVIDPIDNNDEEEFTSSIEEDFIVETIEESSVTEEETIHDNVFVQEPELNEDIKQEIQETRNYKADVLLAKKSPFETKLFAKILDSLGYSYEIAKSYDEMINYLEQDPYKVVLFDKECEGLNLNQFSNIVKAQSELFDLSIKLILIIDTSSEEDPSDKQYVDERIKNVVNKDLLRLVFEKFI
jgi:CheY-like chemotaxis protein